MKKFLIFTGVGDTEKQYLSWASEKSEVYDRAINYYDDTRKELDTLYQLDLEFLYNNSGMIFTNFAKNYDEFKNYKYICIMDSDLDIPKKDMEDIFLICERDNITAAQISRHKDGYGSFNKYYVSKDEDIITDTNFIEMCFTIIRKDLLKLLVGKWNEFELEYSTGIDIILSNIAYHNDMLPFKVYHKYKFYNPHPHDKGGRQIDSAGSWMERVKKLNILYHSTNFFKLWKFFEHDGITWSR